ncbi:hypothetical protein GQ53DRAFT_832415 [Thozetella sp. PMI_491]|nr:hypothetical protein GQ53DRAFT_832415 [Thozetella sp. PMI_491]
MNSFNQNPQQQQMAGQAPKADYGDKAFDMLAKKAGHPKITDAARGAFEKVTGKHVSSKISN